jgi:hypothetical protein
MLLEPEGPAQITEYGKRWLDRLLTIASNLDDPPMLGGVTSGMSQVTLAKIVDHVNGKTSFTMPTVIAMALATTAPATTTTGVTIVEAAYTGYARVNLTPATWSNAATSATPSVATNNGAITFPACTGSTSTLLGFMFTDNATLSLGNSLWYGTLASTVISTTQTPPTIATTVMSLSASGT